MFWNSLGSDPELSDLEWANVNRRQGTRAIGCSLPTERMGSRCSRGMGGRHAFIPALVSAVRGVNDPEKPDEGGWGGKFVCPDPEKNHWFYDPMGTKAVYQWRAEVQKEFRRRADWMLP